MRILIFGTGGAGGFFGAQLARAGEDVTFLARGAHLEAIKRDGLRIEMPEGEIVIQPAQATDDVADVGKVDVVILGVKAWQVREAAEAMRPVIGPDTFVVPLQNGVDAPAELSAVLGE
ncbi:MAG TPA: 2-dehydropantoate 2-reductase, partial [Dongiaceae bacterium]